MVFAAAGEVCLARANALIAWEATGSSQMSEGGTVKKGIPR